MPESRLPRIRIAPISARVGPARRATALCLASVVLVASACATPTPPAARPTAPAAPPPLPPRPEPERVWQWVLSTTAEQSLEQRPWWSDPGYAPERSVNLPNEEQPDFEPRTFDEHVDSTTAVCRLKVPGRTIEGGLFTREHGPELERREPWERRGLIFLPLWKLAPGERMQISRRISDKVGANRLVPSWEGRFEGQLPWPLEPMLEGRAPGECTYLSKAALRSTLDTLASRALDHMNSMSDSDGLGPTGPLITEEDLARLTHHGYTKQQLDAVASFGGWAEPALQPLVSDLTRSLEKAARSVPDRFGEAWNAAPPAAEAGLERVNCDPHRVWGPDDKLGAVLQVVVTLGLTNPNRKVPGRCALVFGDKVKLGEGAAVLDGKRSRYLKPRAIPDAVKFGRSGPAIIAIADFREGERGDERRLLRIGERYYRMPTIDFTR